MKNNAKNFELSFNEEIGRFTLKTDLKGKPVCHVCEKEISDETPYFCPELKVFFQKACLINGNHERLILNRLNPTHEDYPVEIIKDDNKKGSAGVQEEPEIF